MSPKWKTSKVYSDILYHKADGIARITINRPHKRNAFRPETIAQLMDAFTDARDDQRVGVVLLTGAGPHTDGKYAFCAGGDQSVRGSAGYVGSDGVPRLNVLDLQKLIRSMPKVVIALVAGYAIGGGHVLHVVCDLAIAADNAKFTLAYIHLATSPDGGASYHLPRAVGQKRAAEIALLGDRFGAIEAERWGLINRVVPLADLEEVTAKLAGRMARGPALAYAKTKALLNASEDNTLPAQLAAETESFAASALTDDFAAGVAGFVEKKPATFIGK